MRRCFFGWKISRFSDRVPSSRRPRAAIIVEKVSVARAREFRLVLPGSLHAVVDARRRGGYLSLSLLGLFSSPRAARGRDRDAEYLCQVRTVTPSAARKSRGVFSFREGSLWSWHWRRLRAPTPTRRPWKSSGRCRKSSARGDSFFRVREVCAVGFFFFSLC